VTGELVYDGDNVTLGYAECGEDLSAGDERHGHLETGDMAQFDEDGYFYIVGRKKRFLKIYGNRVNLDEMERLIKGKFDGIACACAGVDDHMNIFLTDESVEAEVKDFVVSKTSLNPAAFKTIIIDEIPKNDAGKTLYKELERGADYYGKKN
jgi:acyl-CoA synthetase (AMP-forming)/AMP-acid ligase II